MVLVEHKEHSEVVVDEKIQELGRQLSNNHELKDQFKVRIDELKKDLANLRNSYSICERDLIKVEEKVARGEHSQINSNNSILGLEAQQKTHETNREEAMIKRNNILSLINKKDLELARASAKIKDNEDSQAFVKQEVSKLNDTINTVERKRAEEADIRAELTRKINAAESELRRVDDLVVNEQRNYENLNEEYKTLMEKKTEINKVNVSYRETLNQLQCQNSSLVGQLETFQRENEEICAMLRRDEDYKECAITVGASMNTASEMVSKKKNISMYF